MTANFTKHNPDSCKTPIILLHGWGGTLASLEALASEIADKNNNPVYNLELPGFGKSPITKSPMNTKDYATFVKDFVEQTNLKNPILIGHSFGGKIIIDLISQHKIETSKVILINSSGLKPHNSTKKEVARVLNKVTPGKIKNSKTLKSFFYKYVLRERDYMNAKELKSSLSLIVEEHYDELVKSINIQTLLIWGENDSYTPLWMGKKLNETIQNSKLIVVPESTHSLPIKQPDVVANIITDWLKK